MWSQARMNNPNSSHDCRKRRLRDFLVVYAHINASSCSNVRLAVGSVCIKTTRTSIWHDVTLDVLALPSRLFSFELIINNARQIPWNPSRILRRWTSFLLQLLTFYPLRKEGVVISHDSCIHCGFLAIYHTAREIRNKQNNKIITFRMNTKFFP